MILTTTTLTPKAGQKKAVAALLGELFAATRKATGCLSSKLYRRQGKREGKGKAKAFLLLEEWENEPLLEQHLSGESYQRFVRKTTGLLKAAPSRVTYRVTIREGAQPVLLPALLG